jgi:uncharacterized DUF497 family protein
MTTILTKIQRKILQGDYDIKEHCLFELAKDGLTIKDALSAILKAERCIKLTDNESHVRYEILGFTKKGRLMIVVVFISQGTVFLKTGYSYD